MKIINCDLFNCDLCKRERDKNKKMQKRFRFLKLWSKHKEGYIIDSIVTYYKAPYLMQGDDCIQYKKGLHINLWFLIIELDWLTKIK